MIINEEIKSILVWLESTLSQNQNPQANIRYWSKTKTIFFEHIKEILKK